jgi:uncharacterized protein
MFISKLARRTFLQSLGAAATLPLLDGLDNPAHAAAPVGTAPLTANLICAGPADPGHDYDFARLHLLQALYDAGIRTNVFQNYDDSAAIESGDLLVSYTSLVPAGPAASDGLRRYLEKGGRWFALHPTNYVHPEDANPPDLIGSRFITHGPYHHFSVSVTKPNDPLLAGIEPFETDDELYVMKLADDIDVLLNSHWGGTGVLNITVEDAVRPLMYRRRVGQGGVLYLALGHNNRASASLRPGGADIPEHRGSWTSPVFQELVRRGIDWAAGRRPF